MENENKVYYITALKRSEDGYCNRSYICAITKHKKRACYLCNYFSKRDPKTEYIVREIYFDEKEE